MVCAFDVLEHIEDDRLAIQEWIRWLAPNGKMILSVPAHRSRWGAGDVWAGHYRRYDRNDVEQLLVSCGMEVEHLECYGFPLANATELLGNIAYRRMIARRSDQSKEQATASSGVARRSYARLVALICSIPGQAALSVAMALEAMASRTNRGSGYFQLAIPGGNGFGVLVGCSSNSASLSPFYRCTGKPSHFRPFRLGHQTR